MNKIFKDALHEMTTSVGPTALGYSGEISLANLGDPRVVDSLNAMLTKISLQQYVNPYVAVNKAKVTLQLVGIDFECPYFPNNSEDRIVCPLKQWERQGMDMDGVFRKGDAIMDKVPGGLSLVFRFVKFKGIYTIAAEIEYNATSGHLPAMGYDRPTPAPALGEELETRGRKSDTLAQFVANIAREKKKLQRRGRGRPLDPLKLVKPVENEG